jgi:hypothetical protein
MAVTLTDYEMANRIRDSKLVSLTAQKVETNVAIELVFDA